MRFNSRFKSEIADDSTAFATPENSAQYSFRNKPTFDIKKCSSALSHSNAHQKTMKFYEAQFHKNFEITVKRPAFICRNSPKWIALPDKRYKNKAKL